MTVTLEEVSKLRKPSFLLNDDEKKKYREAVRQASSTKNSKDSERALKKAFLLYSGVAARWMGTHAVTGTLRAAQIISASDIAWLAFYPYWKKIVEPVMKAEILRRQLVMTKAAIPNSVLNKMAEDYARRLGQYYTTTSAESMAAGFNAYVNRRVPQRLAAEKVYSAFGLTKRQMNAFVVANFETKITSSRRLDPKARAKRFVAGKLKERLDRLAGDEAYHATQEAEHVVTLFRAKKGEIPLTAERIWVTAEDELVCEICAPMNGTVVGILDHFELPDGTKEWVSGVHPNCRCHTEIVVDDKEDVKKAEPALQGNALHDFNQKHDRDGLGQFASKPKAKVKLKERDVAPIMAQLQSELDNSPFNRSAQLTPRNSLKPQKSQLKPQQKHSLKPQAKVEIKPQSQAPSAVERTSLEPQAKKNTALDRIEAPAQPKVSLKAQPTEKTAQKINLKKQVVEATSNVTLSLKKAESKKIAMEDVNTDKILYLDHPVYKVIDDHHPNYGVHHERREYGPVSAAISRDDKFTNLDEVQSSVEDSLFKLIQEAEDQYQDSTMSEEFDGVTMDADIPNMDLPSVIRAVATHDERALVTGTTDVIFHDEDNDVSYPVTVSYQDVADALDIDSDKFIIQVYRADEAHTGAQIEDGAMELEEAWNITGDYDAETVDLLQEEGKAQIEIIQLNVKTD